MTDVSCLGRNTSLRFSQGMPSAIYRISPHFLTEKRNKHYYVQYISQLFNYCIYNHRNALIIARHTLLRDETASPTLGLKFTPRVVHLGHETGKRIFFHGYE